MKKLRVREQMKRLMLAVIWLLMVFGIVESTYATTPQVNVKVVLNKIEAQKLLHSRGDELYLHIAVYNSDGTARAYTIPELPLFWPSRGLAQIKNLALWDGTLHNREGIELLFSLVERNSPPWHVDDLIGVLKLRMKNTDGHIEAEWSLPDSSTKLLHASADNQQVAMEGDGAEYHLEFQLTTDEKNQVDEKDKKTEVEPKSIIDRL